MNSLNQPTFVAVIVIIIVLAVLLFFLFHRIFKNKRIKSSVKTTKSNSLNECNSNEFDKTAQQVENYYKKIYCVKSVNLKNNRKICPTIIGDLPVDNPKYEENPTISLKKYELEGEPAISVWANEEKIGNISNADAQYILTHWNEYVKVEDFRLLSSAHEGNSNKINYGMEITVLFDKQHNIK